MASLKEIKDRMNSVSNTRKITNAMYLISSTKLRKAKMELDKARPYFDLQESEIKKIFERRLDVHSHYFYPMKGRKPAETYAYLVITADKGLAGAYNHNVLRTAEEEMKLHKKVELYVVGSYGRNYFIKKNVPIEKSFLYTAQNPSFRRAREISSLLLQRFNERKVDEIRVIYSNMENGMGSNVKISRLLPFDRGSFFGNDAESRFTSANATESEVTTEYDFFPSVTDVINNIVPSYVAGFIYGALVDSFCSEQNARMTAMSSANENATQLLAELSVQYNRVRQAAITQEITEVSAGAKAEKNKRKKEAANK
ncbi:MAG: ATP synthase F1 subunit gamma [Eubacterium sp.]|nr:ATP synthase F1 subunit gamma [Eubacterium sp.]